MAASIDPVASEVARRRPCHRSRRGPPWLIAVAGSTYAVAGCAAADDQAADPEASVEVGTSTTARSGDLGSAVTDADVPSTSPIGSATATTSAAASGVRSIVLEALGDEPGGVVVVMVSDGVATTVSVGERDDVGQPLTSSTPSRVGSLAKPVVASMILQLVDERRVDLDATLGDYLPDTPVGADVTIRDLLGHRSGLPDYVDVPEFRTDTLTDRDRRFRPAELLEYVTAVIAAPAGERWDYSNTNYVLLGQLIERVDGVDLNTALRRRITAPLGLRVTRFDDGNIEAADDVAAAWSPGVVNGRPGDPYASIATGAWAAGGLVSTAEELIAFLTALFEGELLSEAAVAAMTDAGPEGSGLGLGAGEFEPGHADHFHHGEIDGYLSFMTIQPDSGDAVVVLTNTDQIDFDQLVHDVVSLAWT